MNTSSLRLLTAAIALLFVAAACAGDTGATWTFAPVQVDEEAAGETGSGPVTEETITDDQVGDTSETAGETEPPEVVEGPEVAATDSPTESMAPEASGGPAGSPGPGEPAPSSEARTIQIKATGQIEFTDAQGERLTDIPVTPGETIVFEVENTAGFPHAFYIGDQSVVSVAGATTDVGIADWSTGTRTVEWVVPEDLTGIEFACTVQGHYTLMHGSFSVAGAPGASPEAAASGASGSPPASDAPQASEAPVASGAPDASGPPAANGEGEARVIDIIADGQLRFTTPSGEPLTDIAVTPGELVLFRVDNTAGYAHNFYIGEAAEVSAPNARTDVGIPDWNTGVQELEWVVPDDVSALQFACTVPGHYATMQGTFSVSP